jgi:deoxyribodipyrimidine photolyase-related protein
MMARMSKEHITVWILGDQLLAEHPALGAALEEHPPQAVRVVLVESLAQLRRRPYHRKKLTLILSAMRHYAARLRDQGLEVDLLQAPTTLEGLQRHAQAWEPSAILTMAASSYRGRQFQLNTLAQALGIPVSVLPNTQFLVGRRDPYPQPEQGKRYRMEYFYREMRRNFKLLLDEDGQPVGGEWNYDRQNREALPKEIELPGTPSFAPDEITNEVMDELAASGHGFGELQGFDLPVTHEQAEQGLADFIEQRLDLFGPYEDAMTHRSGTLFHSLLSPALNLGLLDPLRMAQTAEQALDKGNARLNSVEGFIRQVVGWREYIYWQYWRYMPDLEKANFWGAERPVPAFFWDADTQMNCLRHAFERVEEQGYLHHIERLMLISNFSQLAGLDPAEVNEWFLSGFVDAYDWVMAPNVFGMGLFADGGEIATKPYIASANYINKMSDYCQDCPFDHRQRTGEGACPFNSLYWNFLITHEQTLRANPRMGPNVLGLRHLDDEERRRVRDQAVRFLDSLR